MAREHVGAPGGPQDSRVVCAVHQEDEDSLISITAGFIDLTLKDESFDDNIDASQLSHEPPSAPQPRSDADMRDAESPGDHLNTTPTERQSAPASLPAMDKSIISCSSTITFSLPALVAPQVCSAVVSGSARVLRGGCLTVSAKSQTKAPTSSTGPVQIGVGLPVSAEIKHNAVAIGVTIRDQRADAIKHPASVTVKRFDSAPEMVHLRGHIHILPAPLPVQPQDGAMPAAPVAATVRCTLRYGPGGPVFIEIVEVSPSERSLYLCLNQQPRGQTPQVHVPRREPSAPSEAQTAPPNSALAAHNTDQTLQTTPRCERTSMLHESYYYDELIDVFFRHL